MKTFLLAAAATFALAAPAQATPQSFYFTCGGSTPLTNVDDDGTIGWSAEKPATASGDGGGCLTVDPWIQGADAGNTFYDSVYAGRYAGEVKQLDLTLYALASNPAYAQLGLPRSIDVRLLVGGEEVYAGEDLQAPAEAEGDFTRSTWTITDLDIPATTAAKDFQLTVNAHYTDDPIVWGRGASDLPSGITFYALEDIPLEDPGF